MTARRKTWLIFITLLLVAALIVGCFVLVKLWRKSLYPIKYQSFVEKYSVEYSIPQELIYAVIYSESHFDKDAVSRAGAVGLMQIMPATFVWLMGEDTSEEDIFDPESNIKCGVMYLSFLYKYFGNWDTAIAGYNAGNGRVSGWLNDTRYSDDGKTLKYIPLDETRRYVEKVKKVADIYIELYFNDTAEN